MRAICPVHKKPKTGRGFVCGFCVHERRNKAKLKALSLKVGQPIKAWLKRRYAGGAKLWEIGHELGYSDNSGGTMCRLFRRLGIEARPAGGAKPGGVTDRKSAAFKKNMVRMRENNPVFDDEVVKRIVATNIPYYRSRASKWELLAMRILRGAGHKPVHQFQVGRYAADIAIPARYLDIEISGANHYQKKRQERDAQRDRVMRRMGWRVVKVGHYHKGNVESFVQRVLEAAQ